MAIKDLRKLNEENIKVSEAKELLEAKGFTVAEGEIALDESSAVDAVKELGYTVIAESDMKSVEDAMADKVMEAYRVDGGLVIAESAIKGVEEAMETKIVEKLKEDGALIILDEDIESVEEAMETKIVEKLKEDGFQVLDEEMLDAIDEELETMIAEAVDAKLEEMSMGEGELPKALKDAIAKKKAKEGDKEEAVAGDEDGKKVLMDKDGKITDPAKDGKVSEGDDEEDDEEEKGKDGEEKVPVKKESTKEAFLESLIGEKIEPAERAKKKSLLESLTD